MMKSARIVNLNVNKCPSAARIPELASDSGIAPQVRLWANVFAEERISHTK